MPDPTTNRFDLREYGASSDPLFLDDARMLFREYELFLNVDLCFQNYEDEIAYLPGKYARPSGCLILAYEGTSCAGCIAVRAIGEGLCEMKRLFVRETFRGKGLGKLLAEESVLFARQAGYATMVLDTLSRLTSAVSLYRSMGFNEIPAYYGNPLEGVIYLGKNFSEDSSPYTGT